MYIGSMDVYEGLGNLKNQNIKALYLSDDSNKLRIRGLGFSETRDYGLGGLGLCVESLRTPRTYEP